MDEEEELEHDEEVSQSCGGEAPRGGGLFTWVYYGFTLEFREHSNTHRIFTHVLVDAGGGAPKTNSLFRYQFTLDIRDTRVGVSP